MEYYYTVIFIVLGLSNTKIYCAKADDRPQWVLSLVSILSNGTQGEEYIETCGASLIDKRFALTAAHCVNNSEHMFLYAGQIRYQGKWLDQKKVIDVCGVQIHPDYQKRHENSPEYQIPVDFNDFFRERMATFHDVAVLKLCTPIRKSKILPISKTCDTASKKATMVNQLSKKIILKNFKSSPVSVIRPNTCGFCDECRQNGSECSQLRQLLYFYVTCQIQKWAMPWPNYVLELIVENSKKSASIFHIVGPHLQAGTGDSGNPLWWTDDFNHNTQFGLLNSGINLERGNKSYQTVSFVSICRYHDWIMEAKMKLEKEKGVTDYSSLLRFICFETETCEAL